MAEGGSWLANPSAVFKLTLDLPASRPVRAPLSARLGVALGIEPHIDPLEEERAEAHGRQGTHDQCCPRPPVAGEPLSIQERFGLPCVAVRAVFLRRAPSIS